MMRIRIFIYDIREPFGNIGDAVETRHVVVSDDCQSYMSRKEVGARNEIWRMKASTW